MRFKVGLALLAASLVLTGCFSSKIDRKGVFSQDLPLTVDDIKEIRAGEENHKKILETYTTYENTHLETYLNLIADHIAEVSTRPHLPYHVVLLDTDEVNFFGGPGGYLYVTRGLLNFVGSESEIAALMANEIAHIAHQDYSAIPHKSKMQSFHSMALRGTELARDSIGTYGTAAYYGVKGVGKVAPYISRRFDLDQEVKADEAAVRYLMAADYDPRALLLVQEKLARVDIDEVANYVNFFHIHPPFPDRRAALSEHLRKLNLDKADIHFRADTLSEVRQMAVNEPREQIFAPRLGIQHTTHVGIQNSQSQEPARQPVARKRPGWF